MAILPGAEPQRVLLAVFRRNVCAPSYTSAIGRVLGVYEAAGSAAIQTNEESERTQSAEEPTPSEAAGSAAIQSQGFFRTAEQTLADIRENQLVSYHTY